MQEKKKHFSAVIAVSLALSILAVSTSAAVSAGSDASAKKPETQSVHNNVDITTITGEVVEPPMLTSAASSVAKEKQWYEYVYYSEEPIFHTYLSDNIRLSFYDPYDYSTSLIMEVSDNLTDWSSNNSLQISYTTGKSIENTTGKSNETTTTVLEGYTDTETTTTGPSKVTTTVTNQTDNYNTSKTTTSSSSSNWSVGADINTGILGIVAGGFMPIAGAAISAIGLAVPKIEVGGGATSSNSTTSVISTDGSGRSGYSVSNNTTTVDTAAQKKTVERIIADRTSRVTGEISSSSVSISFDEGRTITKTYDAAYFNDKGSPLQWKIVEYTVKMPMYYQLEYLIDGEWIFGDSNYCTINTIQGTCRAWLQNNVAYYEHWGTGEPVTWDEFWSQFFTEEKLIEAYKNKLYPDN